MTDVLSEFAAMLDRSAGASGSTELLVTELGEEGELVRRCAIPHQFTADLLCVLDPALTPAAADRSFDHLARLSLVTYTSSGLALHDRARRQLFAGWLEPERFGTLREISKRLSEHFKAMIGQASGLERERLSRLYLFHFVAVDQDAGIDLFEVEFKSSLTRVRYTPCENLLQMVREYESVLTPANMARVNYREGTLALDRGKSQRALELFTAVIAESSLAPKHRAKALNGIGLAYAGQCHWKAAARAFLEALEFADRQEETRMYRCGFLRNLAAVYRDTGNIEAAEKLLFQSASMTNDRHIRAMVHNTFGTLYIRAGQPGKAVASLQESLIYLEEDDFARARVYNNLGLACVGIPDFKASEGWFDRSLEMKAAGGDSVGQANTHINRVRLYREQQAPEKAIVAASTAAELFAHAFFWKEAGDAYAMLLRFYLEAKKPQEAAQAMARAFAAYERAHAGEEIELLRTEFFGTRKPRPALTVQRGEGEAADAEVEKLAQELTRDWRYAVGKKAWLAGVLSIVIGLGQFYNGDWKKAFAMIVLTLGLIFLTVLSLGLVAIIGAPFVWIVMTIWSVTDACLVAKKVVRRW